MTTETAAPPLPVRSLHHVARVTRHLEESRAFYRDVLGFQEIARPRIGFPGAWLFNYGLQIHLIVNQTTDEGQIPGPTIETRDNHLAFLIDGAEVVETRLKAHGVEYRVNYQANTGLKQVFFRDPDGHHVEVACYPG